MTSLILAAAAVTTFSNAATSLPDIKLKGYLGERLDTMIQGHVIGTDVDYITAAYQEKTETKGWWQSEFWGKYMHSAVPYAYYVDSAKLRNDLRHGVDRMLQSQEPCGYIGNYPDELRCGEGWDVWGMKYTLLGLLHYYDYVCDKAGKKGEGEGVGEAERVIEAAKKLCDYVIGEIGPKGKRGYELWTTGNWSGYASSSILEPVVWLYQRTGEKRYLEFAEYVIAGIIGPERGPRLLDLALNGVSVADRNGPDFDKSNQEWSYVCKHNRWKAYEMMSCYQGMLEYVETVRREGRDSKIAKGADDFVKAAVMTGDDIVREEINLAGGCASSEAWFHGAKKQHLPFIRLQETCVTTTWMRFCEKLLEMTDDPKWADQIERTFYNAYLGAMKADGREFAAYTPLTGNRYHGMNHCYMHTDCCTANGPRGFLCFLREFFKNDGKTATFNFYGSALVPGFEMYSLYPRKNYARIVCHTTGEFAMRLRIPAWTKSAEVKLNGKKLDGVVGGRYFRFDNVWKLGDIVEVTFDMPVVAHTLEHNVAFTRGPVLLARDSRFNDGDLCAAVRYDAVADGQVMPTFADVRVPTDDMWMAFSATLPLGLHEANPEGSNPETVFFCDYASAGNEWRPGNYYRTWFPVTWLPQE